MYETLYLPIYEFQSNMDVLFQVQFHSPLSLKLALGHAIEGILLTQDQEGRAKNLKM